MATVHRFGRMRVVVRSNDHSPSHVHVENSNEASFYLNCPNGPPELRYNYGFSRSEIAAIEKEIASNLRKLCEAWSKIHGAK